MNKLSLIEKIVGKCEEVQSEVEYLKSLAGKASDPKWSRTDPGYTKLKDMARLQAGIILTMAQELKALVPD